MVWIRKLFPAVALVLVFSGIGYAEISLVALTQTADQLFFPEAADGASGGTSWRTTLIISNRDYGMASISVAFIQDDGTPMTVSIQGTPVGVVIQGQTGSIFRFTLPPLGKLQIETMGAGDLKTGWVSVQADKSIAGISIFSLYSGGKLVGEVGAPATQALNSFSFAVERQTDVDTAFAFANPGSSTAQAQLILRDAGGFLLDSSVTLTIPGHGHVQMYLTELYPENLVPPGFRGTLEIGGLAPIVGMSLRQREMDFTWLPLIPPAVSPNFIDRPLVFVFPAFIAGRWCGSGGKEPQKRTHF